RAEELFKNVVFVGGQHQPAHGQPHFTGDVPGKNVAKIARRHAEGHVRAAAGGRGAQPTPEVVHDLRGNARPVDRVHRTQPVGVLEFEIARQRLDDILAVVEHAVDGDVVNVGVLQRV